MSSICGESLLRDKCRSRLNTKGVKLDCGYRLDLVVENSLILEIKCLAHILPVHEAQLLTYLKITGKRVGLILNFNVSVLTRGGIVRKVL
jgi:GxxExxY protein